MLQIPRLKNSFRIENLAHDRLLLISEKDSTLIIDPKKILLLNKLEQGDKTLEELLHTFPNELSPFEVMGTYFNLQKNGYITETSCPFDPEIAAYWENQGYDPVKLAKIFQHNTISIESIGSIAINTFQETCIQTGLQILDKKAYLRIVVCDDYNHSDLANINKEQLVAKKPWMLVKLNGTETITGPIFLPDQTACWQCLKHRLELNQPINRFYKAYKGENSAPTLPFVAHPVVTQLASSLAVLQLVNWLYDCEQSELNNNLIAFDTKTMQQSTHKLLKRPQCSACGNQKPNHPVPLQLSNTETTISTLGGYRSVSHEVTFEKYKHHISPITGIIPYLNPYKPIANAPIHNYSSGRNLALQSSSLFWLNLHLRSGNGGKGKTEIQAKTGAICEAIERYSLMYHGNEFAITASKDKLEKAIHPNSCMNYSDEQFSNREEINKDSTKFYSLIPIPFDSHQEMEWSPVFSITQQEFKYLPSCYCYAQYPATDETKLYSYPDSNGCAAGNTIEEAILQGFLELVERDAAAIWWYNRICRPQVDLNTLNNPYLSEIIAYYKTIDRSIFVLDITNDLGIPVFVAISANLKNDSSDEILYAFGAHHEAAIAIERAIIELNQLLPIVRQEKLRTDDQVFLDWLTTATFAHHNYLLPKEGTLKNLSTDYPSLCPPTIYDSIMYGVEVTKKAGMEFLVLDLTQQDIGLPVVKVIVPGMRHFWRRTAPGRLYNVPVKLGWLKQPNTEDQLNPLSIFI